MKTYSISQLAGAFGLSRNTLSYYDRIGLLRAPERTAYFRIKLIIYRKDRFYTTPWSSMAFTTLTNPAILAPFM